MPSTHECKFVIVELEQHIYGMVDIGRGVTKDRRTIYIYIYISVAQCITVYVGLAQARPNYGGWIVSKVQSLFWRRLTSLRRGVVSTGGGAFQLENTTICGGGVRFDLEEGV